MNADAPSTNVSQEPIAREDAANAKNAEGYVEKGRLKSVAITSFAYRSINKRLYSKADDSEGGQFELKFKPRVQISFS